LMLSGAGCAKRAALQSRRSPECFIQALGFTGYHPVACPSSAWLKKTTAGTCL
jgi:hypothetical protein